MANLDRRFKFEAIFARYSRVSGWAKDQEDALASVKRLAPKGAQLVKFEGHEEPTNA